MPGTRCLGSVEFEQGLEATDHSVTGYDTRRIGGNLDDHQRNVRWALEMEYHSRHLHGSAS